LFRAIFINIFEKDFIIILNFQHILYTKSYFL